MSFMMMRAMTNTPPARALPLAVLGAWALGLAACGGGGGGSPAPAASPPPPNNPARTAR